MQGTQGIRGDLEFVLRRAEPSDARIVAEMAAELYSSDGLHALDPTHVPRTLDYLTRHPDAGAVYIVAAGQCEVAGYVIVVGWWSNEHGGRAALLDELFIVSQWRGKGLGSAVVARIEEMCRQGGAKVVYLEVEPGNKGARRLYDRLGYSVSGRVHMMKRL